MALHLVVAHQTAASDKLIEKLQEVQSSNRNADFVLLVPRTPLKHLWTWSEGDEGANASQIAQDAAARMRHAGLRVVDSIVGPSDPLDAIRMELAHPDRSYDTIVISTLPPGISRWLRQDLPNQVRSRLHRDVITVYSEARVRTQPAPIMRPNGAWEKPTLQELAPMRGSELHCLDGSVGRITEVLYDYVTLDPIWIGVASRPLPFRTLLVPADAVRFEAGHLTVPLASEKIHGQPHVDVGEGIPSLTAEHRIYEYFGIPDQELHDTRVLHAGDQIPGTEQFAQSIFEYEPPSHLRH
jgi:hypothetical protein